MIVSFSKPDSCTLTESTTTLGRVLRSSAPFMAALNLSTVAEGIEDHQQLLMLGSYGCNRMQGYLFGKPAPSEIFSEWLENPEFTWEKDSDTP